ncbi:MarR family winged helix-turn-helix transcriptional regulator [Sphingobium nicotianae]|uniref:MarR family winged helix-turn-helix transcriptional regulator n=1 Tax=Sphingobium nicotianae TaxID=2782607 RepID=A0A9X1DA15_9SPHN|nr:MarR family winged helix-turn-helix transcriptional regulator [Sphingobium nicotianae]MBT2186167.1 MarR family winged helix-turn-helix transcriptional regulator [Sphingobium nicotianae]
MSKLEQSKAAAAPGMDWGALSNSVGTNVRLLRNELVDRIVAAYAPFALRSGALSTMVLIQANPGCSQSELAREVAMDDSAMVAIIDELEQRGLALRSRSTADRRRNSLSLTAQGEALVAQMVDCAMAVERPIRDAMSEKELATLIALLRRAYAAISAG